MPSRQAGSECCHSLGDWWVRSVHNKEAGREESAPKSSRCCDADAVIWAEGSTRATVMQGRPGVAGVPARGMLPQGIPRNLGELFISSSSWEVPDAKGDRRYRERC